MHRKTSSRSAPIHFLLAVVLLSGLLAGCGGDGGSGDGAQQGSPEGEKKQEAKRQGGGAAVGGGKSKIALGKIMAAEPDRSVLILRPTAEVQGGKRMLFKVRDNAEISVNNRPAELTDVKKGQDAQIYYVFRNEKNRAVEVKVIGGG